MVTSQLYNASSENSDILCSPVYFSHNQFEHFNIL